MARISGWAYLVVGGAITAFSRYVGTKSDSKALTLFFWVGVLFLAVGAFKLVARYVLGFQRDLGAAPREGTRVRSQAERPPHARDAIYCARCNASLHPASKFCNWCGSKV